MKKVLLVSILLLCLQNIYFANPIDNTPITKLSELVFDDNNNWTMELYFPFGYSILRIYSIVIKSSNTQAKIKSEYLDSAIYILKTTQGWEKPLEIAEYKLIVPASLLIKKFSYQPDKLKSKRTKYFIGKKKSLCLIEI